MIYGYVHTYICGYPQTVRLLTAAGTAKAFRETSSGAQTDPAQLRNALAAIEVADVLFVTRLDRLARSTRDLLNTIDEQIEDISHGY
jgi:DNA invertase Pin-like site-specific DNA recombinase